MARHSFGGGMSDFPTVWVEGEEGTEETEGTPDEILLAIGSEVTFIDQDDEPVTDLLDEQENPVSVIFVDETGRLPLFYGPDELTCMIGEVDGTRFVIGSRDVDTSLSGLLEGISEDIEQLTDVEERVLDLEQFVEEHRGYSDGTGGQLTTAEANLDRLVNEFPLLGQAVLFAELDSTQAIPSNQWTTVGWSSAHVNEGIWDEAEPGDIVLAYPGMYEITGTLWFSSNHGATNINAGVFSGSQVLAETPIPVGAQSLAVSVVMKRAIIESDGTNVVNIRAWHNSSTSANTPASTGNPMYYSTVCVKFRGATGGV